MCLSIEIVEDFFQNLSIFKIKLLRTLNLYLIQVVHVCVCDLIGILLVRKLSCEFV